MDVGGISANKELRFARRWRNTGSFLGFYGTDVRTA